MRRGDVDRAAIVQCANDENTCGMGASCDIDNRRRRVSDAIRIAASMHRRAVDERASCVRASTRQRFLKQDSVFFNVLVYSGCSAFRFPSARND
jgi:hypothetical protein